MGSFSSDSQNHLLSSWELTGNSLLFQHSRRKQLHVLTFHWSFELDPELGKKKNKNKQRVQSVSLVLCNILIKFTSLCDIC